MTVEIKLGLAAVRELDLAVEIKLGLAAVRELDLAVEIKLGLADSIGRRWATRLDYA